MVTDNFCYYRQISVNDSLARQKCPFLIILWTSIITKTNDKILTVNNRTDG